MSSAIIPTTSGAPLGTTLMDRINLFFRLRRYIKMLGRRWYIVLGCILVGTGGAVYKAVNTQNVYEASTELHILIQVAPATSTTPGMIRIVDADNPLLKLAKGEMTSDLMLGLVQEQLARTNKQAAAQDKPVLLAKDEPSVVRMVVHSHDLEYARQFAAQWPLVYLQWRDSVRKGNRSKMAKDLDDSLTSAQTNLARSSLLVEEWYRQHPDTPNPGQNATRAEAFLASQEQIFLEAQRELKRLTNFNREQLAVDPTPFNNPNRVRGTGENSQNGVNELLNSFNPMQALSTTWLTANQQYKRKQQEYDKATNTLKPRHPYLVKIKDDIAAAQDEMKSALEMIDLKRLARISELRGSEGEFRFNWEVAKTNYHSAQLLLSDYEKLNRDVGIYRAEVNKWSDARRTQNEQGADETLFSPVNAGIVSFKAQPVEPDRRKLILTGLLVGLLLGLAIIYFLDRLDDRLELAEDIEAELDEPVLGQIPLLDKSAEKHGATTGGILITRMDEHSMFAEAVRGVRSAIMLGVQEGKKQVQLVSSAIPGDGKTTFTVNYAVTLALAGHRVLLVDADLRRGNVHNFFAGDRAPGLAEVLQGEHHWTDVMRESTVPGLKYISTGALPGNPGELLIGAATRQFVEEARTEFDYIIFDCPPLTAIDDTFALASMADGLLFVIRSGQTSMRFAKSAITSVYHRGARIFGIVLNGITADNPYYYYNHYYHGYYRKEDTAANKSGQTQLPASKLAAPRNRPHRYGSIEAEAKAYDPSTEAPATSSSKAEQFRARRMAMKRPATPPATPSESAPAPTPPPADSLPENPAGDEPDASGPSAGS